ncbi:thiol:disulfide interchange protein DsbB [Pasteurella langaaensis DSM 22999]|uniref:Disulfide bond formation protein B n=1 Tax=Alitibacter langaaensis DSM 22999 TaxID=1122935 RepID=A0A2U0TH10_9PAST|nr:disulfide bond formation protein DsbB [Pasteurella langaaensis]PVX42818.1 thiol:disulfide interchange protein DsbB [Pasteurella langaaensis DSM 22999]
MLRFFKDWSSQRSGWLILLFSAIGLELTALYFQYGMELQPCVMCIYERVAVLGIAFAGLIGSIAPQSLIIRLIALALGLFSAIKGLVIAYTHVDLQMNPAPWKSCPIIPEFPQTLPLHEWFPFMFKPTGLCSEISWQWLGLTMVQWLVVAFSIYSLVLIIVLISQVKKSAVKNRDIFH